MQQVQLAQPVRLEYLVRRCTVVLPGAEVHWLQAAVDKLRRLRVLM